MFALLHHSNWNQKPEALHTRVLWAVICGRKTVLVGLVRHLQSTVRRGPPHSFLPPPFLAAWPLFPTRSDEKSLRSELGCPTLAQATQCAQSSVLRSPFCNTEGQTQSVQSLTLVSFQSCVPA